MVIGVKTFTMAYATRRGKSTPSVHIVESYNNGFEQYPMYRVSESRYYMVPFGTVYRDLQSSKNTVPGIFVVPLWW
jgi:hypothetical protein